MTHATSQTSNHSFGHIQRHTRCTRIKTLRIVTAPRYDPSRDIESNVSAAAEALKSFCRPPLCDCDAFVIEIGDPRYGEHEALMAIAVLLTLRQLSALDPAVADSMGTGVGRPGWNFEFAWTALSVTAFATCLAPADPGSTFGLPSSFLLFGPARPFLPETAAVALPVWGRGDRSLEILPQFAMDATAFPQRRAAA